MVAKSIKAGWYGWSQPEPQPQQVKTTKLAVKSQQQAKPEAKRTPK